MGITGQGGQQPFQACKVGMLAQVWSRGFVKMQAWQLAASASLNMEDSCKQLLRVCALERACVGVCSLACMRGCALLSLYAAHL